MYMPAGKRKVFTVSGSGDMVTAMTAIARTLGLDDPDAFGIAGRATGLATFKLRTVAVKPNQSHAASPGDYGE